MTITLQGKDKLNFHPVTGEPLKASDYRSHTMADGRVIIDLGDCNSLLFEPTNNEKNED